MARIRPKVHNEDNVFHITGGMVFKFTCLTTNKIFIGQTKETMKQLLGRYFNKSNTENRSSKIFSAIHDYGIENFKIEVLHEESDLSRRRELVIQEIERHRSFGYGFNMQTGGKHYRGIRGNECKLSEETEDEIWNRFQSGERAADLAREFKISVLKVHHVIEKRKKKNKKLLDAADELDSDFKEKIKNKNGCK